MSEIGAGSGSSYPGGLDANASVEINAPNPGKTKARKEVVEDLSACIINIETTLGVDPQGSKATVVARLDTEHNADGSHKDTLIVTVSGHNQSISGRKIFASGISLGVDGLYGTSTTQVPGMTTVGASGAMWFCDDVRTSGSFHSTGQMNAESFIQSGGRVSAGVNADKVDSCHIFQTYIFAGVVANGASTGTFTVILPGSVPYVNWIIDVRSGTSASCSYAAVAMTNSRASYISGGSGTLPSTPSIPSNGEINIIARNNYGSPLALEIHVTAIYR